jgi:hypothetical protein
MFINGVDSTAPLAFVARGYRIGLPGTTPRNRHAPEIRPFDRPFRKNTRAFMAKFASILVIITGALRFGIPEQVQCLDMFTRSLSAFEINFAILLY